MMPSRETETRPRGRSALDRDGASREGGVQPLSEADPARGGVRPLSETEPHPRGRPAHERGEVVPGQRRAPRAERSSA
jgi:hypothetical protein